MIPLVDLKKQYTSIKKDLTTKIQEVIDSCDFIQGSYLAEFEQYFSHIQHVGYTAGCANGTSAIAIVLQALGIGSGDEVITTPHTFIATIEGICHVGAKPVFVDIEPDTYTIDPLKISSAITKHTKAILPVHIYGNPARMDLIMKIARVHKLLVVEDCAQAHLSQFKGKFVGSFGNAGIFSFYPGKNLGAYGDAGAIVTNSKKTWQKSKMLIDHGRKDKYIHQIIGYNQRMDGLQAAILTVKLNHLKEWTKKRQADANLYSNYLASNKNIKTPVVQKYSQHVYHLFVIEVNHRENVMAYLKQNQIACGIHYPIPLHLQPALKYLNYKMGDFPIAEQAAKKILSIPIYAELTKQEIKYIANHLNVATS